MSDGTNCLNSNCPFRQTSESHQKWAAILEQTFTTMRALSRVKGGEYAGDTDRLANFRRNADALDTRMELVWAIYAAKHWDAIQQYIKDIIHEQVRPRAEPITGRIDDLLVYLVLLKMIIQETPQDGLK